MDLRNVDYLTSLLENIDKNVTLLLEEIETLENGIKEERALVDKMTARNKNQRYSIKKDHPK